jgi:glycerophosphoryl diester phosphodiesterase
VNQLTAKQLNQKSIPTLAQVLALRARTNIELKEDSFLLVEKTLQTIARHKAEHRVLVGSFHRQALQQFRKLAANRIATSASAREVAEFLLYCKTGISPSSGWEIESEKTTPLTLSFEALQLPARSLVDFSASSFIACAHQSGLAVHFWTVDEPFFMLELVLAGADGIMTNKPEILQRTLALTGCKKRKCHNEI